MSDKKPGLASVSDAFQKMEDEWNNAPETGYVWTVTIDDRSVMSALGLAKVDCKLKLSCSHVGHELTGVYRGELALDCDIDLGKMKAVMSLLGGGLSADEGCWFKNDNFLMRLAPYKEEDELMFEATLGKAGQTKEEEAVDGAIGALINALNGSSELKDWEKEKPEAMWCDWEYRMTEGDMDMYAKVFAFGGLAHSSGSQTAEGHKLEASGSATMPFAGTFSEHYDETVDSPFPYTIKVYPSKDVVFELHSSGNAVTSMKFYGKIDKIPVEMTHKV